MLGMKHILNPNQNQMQKKYKIYKYTAPNGKIYIGQTCNSLKRRAGNHGEGYVECPLFYKAIKKYGFENFKSEIIADGLTLDEANWLEKYLIAYYHSAERKYGYNLSHGGDGILGYSSPEKNAKISKTKTGSHASEETKRLLSNIHKGKKIPREVVEKTAAWHRGRKRSDNTKKNISEATKRLYQTPEGKAMASKRAWNKRKVTNGEVTYQSVKETAEAIGIKSDTLRKAIYDGRPMRGYHWKYVV